MRAQLMLLVPLAGCSWFSDLQDAFDDVQETIEEITHRTVIQGAVVGVDIPESGQVDLSKIDLELGTAFTLFLADAAEYSELEESPVSGASVILNGNQSISANDEGDGLYLIEPGQGLEYKTGDTWSIEVTSAISEDVGMASVKLPAPIGLSVDEVWEPGVPMTLDLRGQGYDFGLVVVYDTLNGELTWDNRPETILDLYTITKSQEDLGLIEVPASAFPRESVYVLGLAAMVNSDPAEIDGMNTLLSGLMAGRMKLFPVVTLPEFDTDIPFDTDMPWDTDLLP